MKKFIHSLATCVFVLYALSACSNSKDEPAPPLKNIELTAVAAKNSVTLSWKPVANCSWYRISFAKKGETFGNTSNYQNLIDNPITYTISNLTANTAYDIKMDGADYAVGGQVFASKTISVTTLP
jgi:hypothetical protein